MPLQSSVIKIFVEFHAQMIDSAKIEMDEQDRNPCLTDSDLSRLSLRKAVQKCLQTKKESCYEKKSVICLVQWYLFFVEKQMQESRGNVTA
jgi:hypothetical protein